MTCSGKGYVNGEGSKAVIAVLEFATVQLATRASKTAVTEVLSPIMRYVTELVFQSGCTIASTSAPPGRLASLTLRY